VDIFTRSILNRAVTSKSKDPIAAACVYLACRMENYPRTLDEVSFGTGVDARQVNKMQQAIARRLQLSIGRLRPYHLVNRFAAKVGCPHEGSALALAVCQALVRLELLETQAPQVLAAGSLVLACLLERVALDLDELSRASLVATTSIKSVYRHMHQLVATVVPVDYRPRGGEDRAQALATLPANLDKFGDKLPAQEVTKQKTENIIVNRVSHVELKSSSSSRPVQAEEPDAVLEDLVLDLARPVPARVSLNNQTVLLQEKGLSPSQSDATGSAPVVETGRSIGTARRLSETDGCTERAPVRRKLSECVAVTVEVKAGADAGEEELRSRKEQSLCDDSNMVVAM
jgi:transcription initiation factor TFIIIB Brf1 subunit/transcription initiation factor TFIIB